MDISKDEKFHNPCMGFGKGAFKGKFQGFIEDYKNSWIFEKVIFKGKLCGFLKNHFQEMRKFHKLWKIILRVKILWIFGSSF